MTGVDGHWDGSDGGHGLHESTLLAAGDVNEPSVIDGAVGGVIVTWLVILREEEEEEDEWDIASLTDCLKQFQGSKTKHTN